MRLAPGFVVGGRYRIAELVHTGTAFRVYAADSIDDDAQGPDTGPGRVSVKVARHAHVESDGGSLAGLQAGRQQVADAWRLLKVLHEQASSAAPLPLELVYMYPGDPDVRRVALVDKALVRREPYLVTELANGSSLANVILHDRVDEERALLLALRVVLVTRAAYGVGVLLTDVSPNNFVVDHAGENVSIVDVCGVDVRNAPPIDDRVWAAFGSDDPLVARRALAGEQVAPALGRLLVALLGGVAAPAWPTTDANLERWEAFIVSRRIPREFHRLLLGCLGYLDAFDATPERVEQRIRALVRARPPRVYQHVERARDTPYLIEAGERIAERFEVLGPLGQGGRGFVYRARDERSGVAVLIKTNKYQYDAGSTFSLELPTRRQELEHEYSILREFASRTGMLPQPVALVRGTGRGAWFDLAPSLAYSEPYVVMEHIKGIPLLDLLPAPLEGLAGARRPENRLSPSFVLRLVAQVAELLQTFHDRGYLVQDLKPENVLWDPRSENVYLVDFAAVCPRVDGVLDKESVAFGTQTHGFAAPEFADLWERSDERFDIYSLGATAYHLLTGVNPERLALEAGTEYPELPLHLLGALPQGVGDVVRRCLAPVEHRYKSAAEVFTAAETARLRLSRSRPLDVRALRVEYTDEGTALAWHLPVDPRIDRVRVFRRGLDAADGEETLVFQGAPAEQWVDDAPVWSDRIYRVETGLERRGEALHSRGRSARAEAHPAPIEFEAMPGFGGVRLRVVVAAHAAGATVRWSHDTPPTSASEGEEVTVAPGGWVLHELPPGAHAHYAAFARYDTKEGPAAHSAARFGMAHALRSLPTVDALALAQSAEGIALHWGDADPRWRVAAMDRSGRTRVLEPNAAGSAFDRGAKHGERVDYLLFAREGDVDSDAVARCDAHRWPDAPDLRIVPGVESVEIHAEEVEPRFSRFWVRWFVERTPGQEALLEESGLGEPGQGDTARGDTAREDTAREDTAREDTALEDTAQGDTARENAVPGTSPLGEATFDALPATVEVPADEALQLVIRACVDGETDGPERRVPVVVPPAEVELRLRVAQPSLPVSIHVALPESAAAWTGEYTLELTEDGESIDAERSAEGEHVWSVVRADLVPGSTPVWAARVLAPTGDVVAVAHASERVLEVLDAPSVVPELAGLRVEAADFAVDYWVEREHGEDQYAADVRSPRGFALAPAELARVRWRRTVDGQPMPWSAPTECRALQRPPAPRNLGLRFEDGRPVLSWEAPEEGLRYAVHATDGRAVYLGSATEVVDWSPQCARAYVVVSQRDGLDSEGVESPALGEVPASSALVVSRAPEASQSPVRLMQCVHVARDLGVVELWTPGPPQRVVVVSATRGVPPDATLQALQRAQLGADRWLGTTCTTGTRTLLPWRGKGPVHVCAAEWRDGAAFQLVQPFVEAVEGRLVGARASDEGTLRLSGLDPLPSPLSLVLYRADAPPERVAAVSAGESEILLPDELDGVRALGLEASLPATLLVPVSAPADAPAEWVWHDAARGAVAGLGRALSRAWEAPIASQRLGAISAFHFLRRAAHVDVSVTLDGVSAAGRADLHVSVVSSGLVAARTFRVALDAALDVEAWPEAVVAWLAESERPARLARWGLGAP